MSEAYLPASLEEALGILASNPAIPVAGGTDLMVRHRRHAALPVRLRKPPMFIATLPELRRIRLAANGLEVGAAVTLSELAGHEATPAGLIAALSEFASPAIRNSATIGGNICNASPAADTLPFLYAANATVRLARKDSVRELPIASVIIGPGQTALGADELLVSVVIPTHADHGGREIFCYYRKVAPRRSNALSKLSVYAESSVTDDRATDFRLTVGAVAPTVVRSSDAERMVEGTTASDLAGHAEEILNFYDRMIAPIDDQRSKAAYRRNTALRLIRDIVGEKLPAYLEKP